MSKELEYIQRQIDIVKQQVKGSKMKIIVTDSVTKHQYDYYENELQTLESIEQALELLEAIDNAEPSEALECLDKIVESFNETTTGMYGLGEVVVANDLIYGFKEELDTIKQALIKAQKDEKIIFGIEDYLNLRIKVEPLEDVRKAFIEIRNQLQVIKEVLE